MFVCNVQKFGNVKSEIDPAKTNREHKMQWPKERKQTMIFRALHKKINIEQQKNRGYKGNIKCIGPQLYCVIYNYTA
jgi:hypothetical protein